MEDIEAYYTAAVKVAKDAGCVCIDSIVYAFLNIVQQQKSMRSVHYLGRPVKICADDLHTIRKRMPRPLQ